METDTRGIQRARPHYISHVTVSRLWGGKTISFDLSSDVNVIIGPNASGKTTIINLLMFSLTGNITKLSEYQFKSIKILLRAFDDDRITHITVTKLDQEIIFNIGDKQVHIPIYPSHLRIRYSSEVPSEILRRQLGNELFELKRQLEGLVPAAWLPVSRRIPISEEDEADRRHFQKSSLESVDECLSELLDGLRNYRVSLDAKLAELRKEFQKHALENILYDKQHDRMIDWRTFQPPTQEDKNQLLKAFNDVGFVDRGMTKRVEEHFRAAQIAVEELKKHPGHINSQTIFIIPLLHRTKQMIEFAQDLESKRKTLFSPLSLYEETIATFINNKFIRVSSRGELEIARDMRPGDHQISWRHLSSGEKQLLILLTQALLWEKHPVVYVADEPELSLHVTWQEKLLGAVSSLAGRCQVIVATHSPDIAGGYSRRVIDLAKI